MKELYVTVTGFSHYYGKKPFNVGKRLRCVKEKNNVHDNEAIKVTLKEIGTIGYIANSPYTKAEGTLSAGRIYDKVGDRFFIEVIFITDSKVICKVLPMKDERPRRNRYTSYVEDISFRGFDEPVPF